MLWLSRTPAGAHVGAVDVDPDDGYAELIAWTAQHAPGPRLVVAIEGTRSYGVGLARAATAAGRPRYTGFQYQREQAECPR